MGEYISEDKFEEMIYRKLLEEDWQIMRQVPSDETIHWEMPQRLDLMIKRNDILEGQWIGIELKNLDSLTKGAKIWEASKQIKRYSLQSFNGQHIKYWCLGIPHVQPEESISMDNASWKRIAETFAQSFLNSIGIALLIGESVIEFAGNAGEAKVRLFKHPNYTYKKESKEVIDNIVKKLNEFKINLI